MSSADTWLLMLTSILTEVLVNQVQNRFQADSIFEGGGKQQGLGMYHHVRECVNHP